MRAGARAPTNGVTIHREGGKPRTAAARDVATDCDGVRRWSWVGPGVRGDRRPPAAARRQPGQRPELNLFAARGRTRRRQLAADDGTQWPRFSAGASGGLPQVVRERVGGDWWKRLVEAEYVVRVVSSFDFDESAVVLIVVGLLPVC
jgi:hypothetical protein